MDCLLLYAENRKKGAIHSHLPNSQRALLIIFPFILCAVLTEPEKGLLSSFAINASFFLNFQDFILITTNCMRLLSCTCCSVDFILIK